MGTNEREMDRKVSQDPARSAALRQSPFLGTVDWLDVKRSQCRVGKGETGRRPGALMANHFFLINRAPRKNTKSMSQRP